MYAAYFGLTQEPFSIAPDPRLLFLGEQHREALAHLLYGVRGGGGFVLLTGEIGTGKTTVSRAFLEQVPPHCNLAYVFHPRLTVLELLETVCHEFGVAVRVPPEGRAATVKDHLDPLNAFLLEAHAAGRRNVLVIDEAQNLAADVLEQLRLLTNLETSERKLLQIVLIGQPELRDLLARPELEQLAQRVIARYHLGPLGPAETALYVRHRLEACGLAGPMPFDERVLRRIHRAAGGVPRRINLLCDRALLGAYATGEARVTPRIVERAAAEVFGAHPRARRAWRRAALAGVFGAAVGAGLLAVVGGVGRSPGAVASASVEAAPAGFASLGAASAGTASAGPAGAVPAGAVPAARLLRDEQAAWRELATAWNVRLPANGEACAALAREAVQCYRQKLSLPTIRALARPGIVTLDAASGRPSYAVLVALDDVAATLRAAGTQQRVSLAALAARWDGEFATLWRTPPGYDRRLQTGARGLLVDWVAERLTPPAAGAAPAVFDARLRGQLRAFQTARGLPADGQPGPLTYMELNRVAGVEEPRLAAPP